MEARRASRPLLGEVTELDAKLALASLVLALLFGVAVVAEAALAFRSMPERLPVHFDASGTPDAWGPRTFPNIMLLPIVALLVPALTAGTALMTAHAGIALAVGGAAPPREAQEAMRRSVVRLLAGITILSAVMLALMAHRGIAVALGRTASLGWLPIALGVALFLYATIGAGVLVVRHGFPGADKRDARPKSPDQDDARWRAGLFYVNAEDPALMVEKRIGVGYTFNFAHPAAKLFMIALVAVFAVIFGLVGWSVAGS